MKMKLKGKMSKNNVDRSLLPITRKVFGSIRYKNVYYVFSELKMKVTQSYPLFATLWTIVSQAPLSMGLSRQEYWSGLPCPSPGNLPNPGVEPKSSALQADFLPPEPPGKPFYVLEEPTIIFLSNSF